MRKAKSLSLTAAFVIWCVTLIAFPVYHRRLEAHRAPAEKQNSMEPGLFLPLLGAWTLPGSPILKLSPSENLRGRP